LAPQEWVADRRGWGRERLKAYAASKKPMPEVAAEVLTGFKPAPAAVEA
jgi:hypothetical protein